MDNNSVVSEKTKFKILLGYSLIIVFSSFIFNAPVDIISKFKLIIISPSVLLTDYILLSNLGATFLNSGLSLLAMLLLTKISNTKLSGPIIAGIVIVGGFAFFGKNIYNIWAIIVGVYLYSIYKKQSFNRYIIVALFSTALAPIVSQISFGLNLNIYISFILANIIGIIVGFIMPPLASHFVNFHQGFNLYNIGFTAGIVGSLLMSVLRLFNIETQNLSDMSLGNNNVLYIYFIFFFLSIIIIGYYLNDKSFKGYKKLMSYSGRLVTDFISLCGFAISFINMGVLGLISLLYVFISKGNLDGPTIGAIFTVVAFGGFGKHPKNIIPVMLGIFILTFLPNVDRSNTVIIIAALFATCLAPISGKYGWPFGVLAGIVHLMIVMNTAYLHGGINLYNNGFAAGIVAAILVPLIDAFRKED